MAFPSPHIVPVWRRDPRGAVVGGVGNCWGYLGHYSQRQPGWQLSLWVLPSPVRACGLFPRALTTSEHITFSRGILQTFPLAGMPYSPEKVQGTDTLSILQTEGRSRGKLTLPNHTHVDLAADSLLPKPKSLCCTLALISAF